LSCGGGDAVKGGKEESERERERERKDVRVNRTKTLHPNAYHTYCKEQ